MLSVTAALAVLTLVEAAPWCDLPGSHIWCLIHSSYPIYVYFSYKREAIKNPWSTGLSCFPGS